ncbi:hypothetical protein QFZ55_007019 [Streptomyces luteogriseus]|nr:hypothetical protein [Streptomyces luteogriseus]
MFTAPGRHEVDLLTRFESAYDGKLLAYDKGGPADADTARNEAHAVRAIKWLAQQRRSGYVFPVKFSVLKFRAGSWRGRSTARERREAARNGASHVVPAARRKLAAIAITARCRPTTGSWSVWRCPAAFGRKSPV